MTHPAPATPALTLRAAHLRGRTDIDWLDSRHSFSFGGYQDARHMGFGPLRVINDDRVAPGGGFGEHGHRDMEILTWVLDGALLHRDSLGHESTLRPGQLQVMTAGRGIRHSEFNASASQPVHFLQIWITPDRPGHPPAYAELTFPPQGRAARWQLLASPDGRDGSARIQQDATLSVATLGPGQSLQASVAPGRSLWLQVARGQLHAGDQPLQEGDGLSAPGTPGTPGSPVPVSLPLHNARDAEILLFDLP